MVNLEAKGINGARLTFDGATVVIYREGVMRYGPPEKAIPVSALGAVEFKPATALVNGHIQFSVAGEMAKKSRHTTNLATDENSVIFRKSQLPAFEAVRDAIRAAQAGGMPSTAQPDISDQLAKLAALRDQGVLTEEEFTAKKAQLLDRL